MMPACGGCDGCAGCGGCEAEPVHETVDDALAAELLLSGVLTQGSRAVVDAPNGQLILLPQVPGSGQSPVPIQTKQNHTQERE